MSSTTSETGDLINILGIEDKDGWIIEWAVKKSSSEKYDAFAALKEAGANELIDILEGQTVESTIETEPGDYIHIERQDGGKINIETKHEDTQHPSHCEITFMDGPEIKEVAENIRTMKNKLWG